MVKFKIALCGLITALAISALATPPDTLDFGFAKYTKTREGLYHDFVKRVCIKNDTAGAYPSAIVFADRITFLDKNGHETCRDTLPDSAGVRVTESSHGQYIYIFGAPENKPGGFHCLYTFDGKTILKKSGDTPMGTSGLGTPLEGPQAFLMGGFGKVTLTGFGGELIAERQLLNKDLFEDGDIYAVAAPGDSQFFVAANKFKLPIGQATFNRPIFYVLDAAFVELFQDTLQSLLVVALETTPKYLLLREESDISSLLWILDLSGRKLTSFENPKSIVFSSDSDCLLHLPRNSPPEVISSIDWKSIYQPALSSLFSWVDASISSDGSLGTLYNGSEIVLLDIINKSQKTLNYPFAFQTCRLFDNGKKLILSGEFGYEIYERAR